GSGGSAGTSASDATPLARLHSPLGPPPAAGPPRTSARQRYVFQKWSTPFAFASPAPASVNVAVCGLPFRGRGTLPVCAMSIRWGSIAVAELRRKRYSAAATPPGGTVSVSAAACGLFGSGTTSSVGAFGGPSLGTA